MLKLLPISFLFIISVVFAAPSITDYKIIIDGNSTNSTIVYISPQSTPGIADSLRINITANESVDWNVKILNSTGQKVAPGSAWTASNTTNIFRPLSCNWKGTSNQCDGDNLTDGNYTVNVTITYFINSSTNGTINDLSRSIIIDNTPPVILIRSPQKFVNANIFSFNFTLGDITGISLCTMEWINETGTTFNKTLPNCQNETMGGNDGNHTIRLWSNDTLSNTGSETIAFTIDTKAPSVNITSPVNTTYNTSSVYLNYSVSETSVCVRDLDGTNSTIANCTNITVSNLLPGDHVLNLWANDSAGNVNVSSVAFKINYAENYPSLFIQNPANTTYTTPGIMLNYTIFVNQTSLQCFYSLNNGPNTSLENCTNTTLSLADGSYFLQIFANNSYFINSSKVSFAVDATPPSLTVNSPVNTTYSSASVLLSFVTSADAICSYEINGATANLPGCLNATITAANGFNRITIFAKDSAGNANSKSINFTVTVSESSPGSSQQSNNQNTQQQINTTKPAPKVNQTNKINQSSNPTLNQTNQTETSINETNNQAANITSPATGFTITSPISLETAAMIAAIIIIIITTIFAIKKFKPRFRKPKHNDGVVIMR